MTLAARRFLVVPDAAFDAAEVVSATATGDGSRQEAGRQVEQPQRSAATPPEGDIALTLSGEPEVHVEGITHITRGGVVEDARFGWVRSEDDPQTDLQFRQSPHVVGRRPDLIKQLINEVASYSGRPVRPRLLALKSGDLLMVWRMSVWMPIWARAATGLGGGLEAIQLARLNHTDDTWSEPFEGPIPFDVLSELGQSGFVCAIDMTQFPDTAEIVLCICTCGSMTPGSADPRILWVYISQDDGDSWVLRHRLHFDGAIPDITLDTDGDGDVDDTGPIQDWALELLDSGRLCLFTVTENYTWSLTSDDRGASWAASLVSTHAAANQYAGHGVGATKARNGMACFMRALRDGTDGIALSLVSMRFTRDGQSFSAAIPIPQTLVIYETVDVTCCVSPDGWPHVYGTEHASKLGLPDDTNPQDWLWGRRLTTRDPSLNDDADTILPTSATASGPAAAFHIPDGVPLGSYAVPAGAEDINPCRYYGFTGLDVVQYRGQAVLATVVIREGAQLVTNTQSKLDAYGLMVYRLNHWQPIQERVNNAFDGTNYWPAWPAIGRIYNETWDCYDHPASWGWTNTGGAGAFVVGGAEGGYYLVSGAPKYWYKGLSDTGSGAQDIGMSGNIRAVLHVESGGSVANDTIAIKVQLSDGTRTSSVSIRFERSGDDVKIQLYNNTAGANVGGQITITGTGWIEVLYAQNAPTVNTTVWTYLYARPYPRATDPDWDEPYSIGSGGETINTSLSTFSRVDWGHLVSGSPESWWKCVHIARSEFDKFSALQQGGIDYIDNDGGVTSNDRTVEGTGEPPLDNGLDNYMRTCRTLAVPPMFMCRNVYARFRGEAVTEGDFDYTTGYAYAARNILLQPVMREWRSVDDGVKCSIVLQAPDDCGFRPDALAVFGHNCSGFTIQFNDVNTDVGWASPAVTMQFSPPNMPGFTPDRYTHLWAYGYTASVGWTFAINTCRLTISGPNNETPWRSHQFKSGEGSSGQQFYVAISATSGGSTWVFRIVDNTGDTLLLESQPGSSGIATGGGTNYNFSIFSDRFSVMVGHHLDANQGVGYLYCRVQTRATIHPDAGRDFARVGRMVFGTAVELSTPDFERGWSTGFEDGSELVEQPTGAAYGHRKRPMLRTWQADRPWMNPPAEASQVYNSPDDIDTRASWQQWVDAVRRLDGVKTACALVWEGARFVGFEGEERVQCCADPKDLAMCHVTGLGDMENTIYDGRVENLAGGASCVPLPVSHIRGLRFRETL